MLRRPAAFSKRPQPIRRRKKRRAGDNIGEPIVSRLAFEGQPAQQVRFPFSFLSGGQS